MNKQPCPLILRRLLADWVRSNRRGSAGASPSRRRHLAGGKAHQPNFRARQRDDFITISDGDVPVALLHRPTLRLELREFYPDRRAGSSFAVQRPYHWPSFRGAYITVCWWIGCQCVCSSSQRVKVSGGGRRLEIRIDETFGADEAGAHMLEFYFDAALGCYGVAVRAELALLNPRQVEVSNFHAEGVGQAWEDTAKLRHTLWANQQGGLTFFPHNPLTPNTPGNMDWLERRRVPIGGFLGFGTRPEFNPVLEILACHSPAMAFATCSNSYDEHFMLWCPTPLAGDGQYRWHVQYRLVSLPEAFSRYLRQRARRLDFGTGPAAYDSLAYLEHIRAAGRQVQPLEQSLPFRPGQPSDCETPIDPGDFLAGHYWVLAPQPHGAVQWDRRVGYRSRSSLRLTGRTAGAQIVGNTFGPSIMIFTHKAFSFSAMVKTALGRRGQAWLEIEPCTFAPGDCHCVYRSKRLRGRRGWTRLEVTVRPPAKAAFLFVSLHLQGQGDAWFDNIELQRARA